MNMVSKRFYHTSKIRYKDILVCRKKKLETCLVDVDMVDPCKPGPTVLIIGAGISGLSAASRLNKAGITNVTVLEAAERPGGRIQSCWIGNAVVDTGAQWIHGSSVANSTMTLAAQAGLLDPAVTYRHVEGTEPGVIYMTSDNRIVNKALAIKAYLTFKQIEKNAYSLYEQGCGREHGSLMTYLMFEIEEELKKFNASQRNFASNVMCAQTNLIKNRWGADLDKMSADLLGSHKLLSGETIGIPHGYVRILSPIMADIPHANIVYNKVVNGVQWARVCNDDGTPAGRSRVTCCDGTSYCADYVILTVSLGVLKAVADKIFEPKLPAEKLTAIKQLGFGNTCKIFMEYSRPFWVWREGTINLAWSTSELKKKDKWVTGVSTIEEVAGSRQVLLATVAGDQATMAEGLADHKVVEDITAVLRSFTGDPTLPYPHSVLMTRWKGNAHFAGSNSYMSIDSNVGHQCDLATSIPVTQPTRCAPPPVAPVLLFAGEATCPDYYSTVHGARLSGLRVAQEVIDLTRLYQGPPPMPGEYAKQFDPC